MAQRTTKQMVMAVLTGDFDPAQNLQPFINQAAVLMARVVACAIRKGHSLTADVTVGVSPNETTTNEATEMETLLAAHFYKYARDRQLASRSTDGASGSYTVQPELLLGTTYGSSALLMDWTGCLRAAVSGSRASARWLGRRPSAQTAYVNRR